MTTRFCIALLVFVMLMLLTPVLAEEEAEDLGPALDRVVLGDPEGAVRLALELTRENPANPRAWYLCGMLRFHDLAEYAAAVECFDRVVDLVQQGAVEFPEMGHVYRSRGMSHYYLGELYLLQGDETRAELQFEKVMQTGMEKYNEYRMAQAELERLADR